MCGTRGGQAAGGVEPVAIVRSRDRCLLLRFTILERAVLGSSCEQGGCVRRFGTLIECTLSLAKKVGSVRAAKTYHIPLYCQRLSAPVSACQRLSAPVSAIQIWEYMPPK